MSWKSVYSKVVKKRLEILGREPTTLSDLIFLQDLKVIPEEHQKSFQYLFDLQPKRVLEIGCGCGSLLYLFYKNNCEVFGIDYVPKAINIAQKIMPKGQFKCCDANNISFEGKFDLILSNSVFQYFDSLEYAKDVIKTSLSKLDINGNLIITDLPRADTEKEFALFRMKEMDIGEEEWNKRYSQVKHLHYDFDDLKLFVESLGYKYKSISPSNYLSKHQFFKFDIWIK